MAAHNANIPRRAILLLAASAVLLLAISSGGWWLFSIKTHLTSWAVAVIVIAWIIFLSWLLLKLWHGWAAGKRWPFAATRVRNEKKAIAAPIILAGLLVSLLTMLGINDPGALKWTALALGVTSVFWINVTIIFALFSKNEKRSDTAFKILKLFLVNLKKNDKSN